jgi:hypothetical protein
MKNWRMSRAEPAIRGVAMEVPLFSCTAHEARVLQWLSRSLLDQRLYFMSCASYWLSTEEE